MNIVHYWPLATGRHRQNSRALLAIHHSPVQQVYALDDELHVLICGVLCGYLVLSLSCRWDIEIPVNRELVVMLRA